MTPEILERAYNFLRATPPFQSWNLPDHEEVKFRVVRDPAVRGWYKRERTHVIAISARCIGHTHNLITTMAHEMIHLHQCEAKMETSNTEHNAAFVKLAARVCKIHGFDPKLF